MSDRIRGVNLSGWFILEPWVTPSLFAATGASNDGELQQVLEMCIRDSICWDMRCGAGWIWRWRAERARARRRCSTHCLSLIHIFDALALADKAVVKDDAVHVLAVDGLDLEADQAVVDQDDGALLSLRRELLVVEGDVGEMCIRDRSWDAPRTPSSA